MFYLLGSDWRSVSKVQFNKMLFALVMLLETESSFVHVSVCIKIISVKLWGSSSSEAPVQVNHLNHS